MASPRKGRSHSVVQFRPRSEVPRGEDPLPPKRRRRYRKSGSWEGYIGRFQQPMRWAVFGKVIFPDLRPCYRCTLGQDACTTCQNPRRAIGPAAQQIIAEANGVVDSLRSGEIMPEVAIERLEAMLVAVRAAAKEAKP